MGKKKLRNDPYLWDEVKKSIHISVTPTAVKGLDELAQQRELSRSELVERIGRGLIPLGDQSQSQSVQ